ncbi:sodium-independent anion transporter [Snodgrassella alvi]|uniref:Sodium-independent anion transporter n=1 Tax=Snodgrassella alvi TaxID=1196083 RepID=A0A2N9WTM4_9NEIS|nr:SulP family inorganic anion transporter [Snodgrassella alvi]PIT14968.1 sodium-independent anion transporter [Snodgrassella alvi]
MQSLRKEWFSNIRNDALSGLVVALALIPEAIAFSIIAGVDPKTGLYAAFCIAVITAFTGGRPGMISAATGAMALLIAGLVKAHGLEYLLAATILCGIFQIIAGFLKLGNLMRFVSRSVVTGFVNALAILIFLAQLPELTNVTWHVYAMTITGLGIIYLFPYIPKVGKIFPSPLLCILILTGIYMYFGMDIRTVGDMGTLPTSLPTFLLPNVPFNLNTLLIILPYSISLAIVGLLESMMTATIVDDITDTPSDKNRECKGQGIANIVTGFFGGMAGCAMIGQSMVNMKSGGRTRLSSLIAGTVLLLLVVFLQDWVSQIPMAALVAVMIMVSIGTFNWDSIKNLKSYPLSTNIVMLSTVVVVVLTHNLAYGVFVGVLLASLFYANKVAHYLQIKTDQPSSEQRIYTVYGQVFFASSAKFINSFDFKEVVQKITIDLTQAHFWDITAVAALDKVVIKFRRAGSQVEVLGLNKASSTIVDHFGVYDKPDAQQNLNNH